IITSDVMLSGYIEYLADAQPLQDLVQGFEFFGFGQMRKVACVDYEIGRLVERVDLVDRDLQRAGDIRICGLIETHVAVTDLYKRESGAVFCVRCGLEYLRRGNAAGDAPDDASPHPLHTLQETSTVYCFVHSYPFFFVKLWKLHCPE